MDSLDGIGIMLGTHPDLALNANRELLIKPHTDGCVLYKLAICPNAVNSASDPGSM